MTSLETIQCPGCGAAINTNGEYCEYCGTRIQKPKEPKEEIKETETKDPTPIIIQQTIAPETKTTSGAAIASLVFALLGMIPFTILFGVIALHTISRPDSRATGRGLAIAALIISSIQILVWIIILSATHSCARAVAY